MKKICIHLLALSFSLTFLLNGMKRSAPIKQFSMEPKRNGLITPISIKSSNITTNNPLTTQQNNAAKEIAKNAYLKIQKKQIVALALLHTILKEENLSGMEQNKINMLKNAIKVLNQEIQATLIQYPEFRNLSISKSFFSFQTAETKA